MIRLKRIKSNIFDFEYINIHDYGYDHNGILKTLVAETEHGMIVIDYGEVWREEVEPCYEIITPCNNLNDCEGTIGKTCYTQGCTRYLD